MSGEEPTMEDILASIRKIIADDDSTALESPESAELAKPGLAAGHDDAGGVTDLEVIDSDPLGVIQNGAPELDKLADDPLPLDIEAIVNDAQDDAPELDFDLVADRSSDVVDLEIPEIEEADDNIVQAFEDDVVDLSQPVNDDVEDVLSELEGLLAEVEEETSAIERPDVAQLPEVVELSEDVPDVAAPAPDAIAELDELLAAVDAETPVNMAAEAETNLSREEDADLDLVKSLMADLTDADDTDEVEGFAEADLGVVDDMNALADEDDNILDEILDMSLEDELAIPPDADDVAEMEAVNVLENQDQTPSLSDIAAAAEADADKSATAILGAGATMVAGAAAITRRDDEIDRILDVVEDQPSENVTEPEPELAQEETEPMARTAANKETIIEGATETATADAFASLNRVVEEKAVKAERGDRIGDLVMEALQPMLKEWLDANLKGIVERAVTKEVKRISSGK